MAEQFHSIELNKIPKKGIYTEQKDLQSVFDKRQQMQLYFQKLKLSKTQSRTQSNACSRVRVGIGSGEEE